MRTKLAALAALVILAGGLAAGTEDTLAPCPNDSDVEVDCYWDASERGNGQGHDFVVRDGVIYPEGH